mmetsp:Transcript_106391/g.300863  ORF Transcript_106391/g.300863 Transcript_106391/m.300863 type:complete len:892 (+) Transcript_106391:95-2770(+)
MDKGPCALNNPQKNDPERHGDEGFQSTAMLADAIVAHPFKVLTLLAAVLGTSVWWGQELKEEKGMMSVMPHASNSVLGDFPDSQEQIRDVMVFWCKTCDVTTLPEFTIERKAVQGLLDTMRARNKHCSDLGWSSIESGPDGAVANSPLEGALRFPHVSTDKTTSFVQYHSSRRECMRDVRRKLQHGFHKGSGPMLASLGGPESVAGASMDAELQSMMKHAFIAVPVSCFLLWLLIGNIFRVLTPVVCMVTAYLSGQAAVGIFKKFAKGLNVNYDDSFVLFIDLALCVDYALFFWTRFALERAKVDYEEALRQTLKTSGIVIMVSNFFVVVAWTCTLCFPNLNLWGFEALYIEALCGCGLAGAFSLAFMGASAAGFPMLFDNGDSICARVHQRFWDICPSPQSFWKPWAKRITSKPLMFVLPVLAYACMAPFIYTLSRYQPSFDIQRQGSRRDTLEHQALEQFERHFRVGMLSPITLVVEAKEASSQPLVLRRRRPWEAHPEASGAPAADASSMVQQRVLARSWRYVPQHRQNSLLEVERPMLMRVAGAAIRQLALNPEFGNVVCKLAEGIMNKTRGRQYEIQMADMLSIWWLPPQAGHSGCSVGSAKMVINHGISLESGVLNKLPQVLQRSISKDGQKVQLKLFTRFSPSSPEAVVLDQVLRSQLENSTQLLDIGGKRYALKVQHTSAIARQVEANREMSQTAPRIFGVFTVLIAALITLTFRSAFLSIKLALTVILPIVSTYGVTVAVYQLNMLGFLGSEMLSATGGLDFRMIYVTPGVLFGLAMDYDLFLFARVYEYRLEGYDNTSAVRCALAETGPVITAAGILMAISFFAIMLSDTILFRTLGFVFFFGVTFDVFIVRTCIAPVFLCLAEHLNYWPRVMPKATKSWD